MHIDERELERLILDAGLATALEIESLREESAKSGLGLGEMAIAKGLVTDKDLRRMHAYVLGVPFLDLSGRVLDLNTLSIIPEPIARKYNVVAFNRGAESVEVAMLDTSSLEPISFIKSKYGVKILPRLTSAESIKSALLTYQKLLKNEFGSAIQDGVSKLKILGEGESFAPRELKLMAESPALVQIVEMLIKHALLQGASYIHIEPFESETVIRYRVSGHLHDAIMLPKTLAPIIGARLKLLSQLDLYKANVPQDGRFKVDLGGEKIGFRVVTMPIETGERVVVRVLREGVSGFTLESLGFAGENLESLHKVIEEKSGLVLVAGEAHSGKSTTLYTILDLINSPKVSIVAVEETPKYSLPRVSQVHLRPDIGLTSAHAVRTALKQDPDVLLVSRVNDKETALLTLNTSLSGRLALGGVRGGRASDALHNILDLGVDPMLVGGALKAIVAQRLVRVLSADKTAYNLSPEELKILAKFIPLDDALALLKAEKLIGPKATWKDVKFWRDNKPNKAEALTSLNEVLVMSPTLKELMLRGASPSLLEKQAKREGMKTILEDGLIKAVKGSVALEDVLIAVRR